MSHYQGGYQQPPPQQPPSQGAHDQYGNPQPAQNGGYPGQYGQTQHLYQRQQSYDQSQGGGPVQQPQSGYQEGYHSPRSTSFGGGYGGQQPYQQPQTYNPQHYAPPHQPQQTPSYNPQAYAQSPTTPHAPYTPATYALPSAATSGPLSDPYAGYSPGNVSNPAFSSTGSQYSAPAQPQHYSPRPPQPQYSPQPPSHQYSDASPPPPPHGHQYQPPLPPLPQPSQNVQFPDASDYQPHAPRRSGSTQAPVSGSYTISPALPGLSDEPFLPSPPQYHMSDSRQSPSPLQASASNSSLPSPPSSTPAPTPPAHGVVSRSNTLDRHPTGRPLPGAPEPSATPDYFQGRNGSNSYLSRAEEEAMTQDELFASVENEVLNLGRQQRSPSISVSQPPDASYDAHGRPSPLFGPASPGAGRHQSNGSVVNGHLSPGPSQGGYGVPQESDESDAEAAAGLEAMRMAEQQDAQDAASRRQSAGSTTQMRFSGLGSVSSRRNSFRHSRTESTGMPQAQPNSIAERQSDSDDYGTVDMSLYGGGFAGEMRYGGDPNELASANGAATSQAPSQQSSMRRSRASQSSRASNYDYTMDSIHPFPPFNTAARVDVGGSGGMYEPTADGRRQSYDEGDEYQLMEGQLPDRFPDEPPDVFFQPSSSPYRPLPPPPEGEVQNIQTDFNNIGGGATRPGATPYAPDGYGMNAQGQWVPRSTSLISHSNTPQVLQPLRSKTDAEERRLRQQQYRNSAYSAYESTPASASAVAIDLPSLAPKRFVASKLGAPDFKKCEQPWALSNILSWLLTVANPDQMAELREAAVKEALVALFTSKVPTMNIADAEGLSNRVVQDMYDASALQKTEEWVKLVQAPMSGVIYQLTAAGCYAPTLHDHIVPGRCYSHHCQRTLKKVNLQSQPTRTSETWAEYYKLKMEDLEGRDKKEIERQNVLHEIVSTEEEYMEQLNVLRMLYRDPLDKSEPSVISPKRKDSFIKDVFSRVDAIKAANKDHLLPQLKYRQQEEGPWIVGFSDIFRQWIRKAKIAYTDYAGAFPGATYKVRQEMERNIQFAQFLERARNDKRSNKLGWDTYLKAPITRLQRYTLLLHAVLKNMKTESEEKTNLQIAYDEVKNVTLECDARVAENQRKVDLNDLMHKLVLRPGMQHAVELNLNHLGRELIHRGDLQRMGGNRFTWLDCHAVLFDHYMVLAKVVASRADQGGRLEKYDVSRLPIPMDLLMLDSSNDPPVQRNTYGVKGISSVTTVINRTPTPADPNGLARTATNASPGPNGLQHINSGTSSASVHTMTSLGDAKDTDRIMYPFRVKHLGRETYQLFAPTEQARGDWCKKITEAKTKHAAALFAQHAEPFRLRVMSDSAFVYDAFAGTGGKCAVIKGTPVDRAIKEVEHRFRDTGRPGPICRARVNCATTFTTPYPGKQMVAVGTDFGVYVSDVDNPRGWTKTISMSRVTQIAVLEEFNLFLLIADKSLIAYHLDVICPSDRTGPAPANDSARKAPQKLSGSKDVGFFVTGRMKDRTLVFYKKRENLSSTFKVLEPIYQKSSEKKRGMFKRGTTEFFREYDEFYIPAECTHVNLFHSSLAVSTARGFEVMTLDKKQPMTVPDLRQPHVQNIATHVKDQRALGMLRLSDQEFLLCYANCAVYVNKHGDVSRSVIMEFVGNAQSAALYGAYLILFDNDFVEIRNAQNGRLKQIIAGREVKCLDDGGTWTAGAGLGTNGSVNGPAVPGSRTVKVVMQHPEMERTQIIVELLLNEGMKE